MTDKHVDEIKANKDSILELAGWQKVIVFVVTTSLTVGGSYMVFRALTDYRITATEKRLDNHEARLIQMEQTGHPDHERRITKLENRADLTDHSVNEVGAKLDVAIAILQRMDREQQRTK